MLSDKDSETKETNDGLQKITNGKRKQPETCHVIPVCDPLISVELSIG